MSIPIYILNLSSRIDKKAEIRHQMNKLNTINYNLHTICDVHSENIQNHYKNLKKNIH